LRGTINESFPTERTAIHSKTMKTIIHVNQNILRQNTKNSTKLPCLIVRNYKGKTYANAVEIAGPSVVKYSPTVPLNCGARAWVETESEVTAYE